MNSLDHGAVLVVPGLHPLLPLVLGHLVLVQNPGQQRQRVAGLAKAAVLK